MIARTLCNKASGQLDKVLSQQSTYVCFTCCSLRMFHVFSLRCIVIDKSFTYRMFKFQIDVGVMKKNGFTLIELIVVIIILGVLAVTAAPRFLGIQESAREAVLEGVAGAMEGVITQVTSKAIIVGLDPAASNPSDQSNYVIDFGIGSVEVDWGTLCPESRGESGDKLNMLDFLTLSDDDSLTSDFANRYTVVGYEYPFTTSELDGPIINVLPSGCYVLYDSFGGRVSGNSCPDGGCECTVEVVNDEC